MSQASCISAAIPVVTATVRVHHLFVHFVKKITTIPTAAYFAPTIIQTLGYSPIRTQLLSAPPWACSCVLAMLTATLSDRLRRRFVFILVSLTLALTGFTILLVVHDRAHLQYGALYLASMGYFTAMPIVLCWPNMNCE